MAKATRAARVDTYIEQQLDRLSETIEKKLNADVTAIYGPVAYGAEDKLRDAVESRRKKSKRTHIAVVLQTDGGIIEVVERMVHVIRHHYSEFTMIVPGMAMSAGTVFAMAADRIMMDYSSCLGPIDPQIVREGKLVPALSYLVQFERLVKKSAKGKLTTAELALLDHLDLAELHSFEQARELSNSLLKQWLAAYKFKNWTVTETKNAPVTKKMKEDRALEIAKALADHQRWYSHARPLTMKVLESLNLKVDDFAKDSTLGTPIREYHQFLSDYMYKVSAHHFVHTDGMLI